MKKILATFFVLISFSATAGQRDVDLAKKVMPAVVHIEAQKEETMTPQTIPEDDNEKEKWFKKFFEEYQKHRKGGLGSGFFISPDGYVITNYHVIKGADKVFVIQVDETKDEAEIIGYDARADMALLKINAKDRPFVKFSTKKPVKGQDVLAVGSPLGLFGTVTTGIISATDRDIHGNHSHTFIQTDTAINRGNSGGPLFDMDGDVVGINTLIFSTIGENAGIGFAIPAETAIKITEKLMKKEKVSRAVLGVGFRPLNENVSAALGMPNQKGVIVLGVKPLGPADQAGIIVGDVIIEFNGQAITDSNIDLVKLVGSSPIGVPLPVKIVRSYKEQTLTVTLEEHIEEKEQEVKTIEIFGLTISEINDKVRKKYNYPKGFTGFVILAVSDDSPAKGEVQPGEILVDINHRLVKTLDQIKETYEEAKGKGKAMVLIIKNPLNIRFLVLETQEKGPK